MKIELLFFIMMTSSIAFVVYAIACLSEGLKVYLRLLLIPILLIIWFYLAVNADLKYEPPTTFILIENGGVQYAINGNTCINLTKEYQRIFSGETIQLKETVAGPYFWTYLPGTKWVLEE